MLTPNKEGVADARSHTVSHQRDSWLRIRSDSSQEQTYREEIPYNPRICSSNI